MLLRGNLAPLHPALLAAKPFLPAQYIVHRHETQLWKVYFRVVMPAHLDNLVTYLDYRGREPHAALCYRVTFFESHTNSFRLKGRTSASKVRSSIHETFIGTRVSFLVIQSIAINTNPAATRQTLRPSPLAET